MSGFWYNERPLDTRSLTAHHERVRMKLNGSSFGAIIEIYYFGSPRRRPLNNRRHVYERALVPGGNPYVTISINSSNGSASQWSDSVDE